MILAILLDSVRFRQAINRHMKVIWPKLIEKASEELQILYLVIYHTQAVGSSCILYRLSLSCAYKAY